MRRDGGQTCNGIALHRRYFVQQVITISSMLHVVIIA